jgi:uncharacterized membrane protein YdjX (TVP38/TMEM64 family)
MTRKSLNYACLTQVVRNGGFFMAFMIRLSAIPTHFSTVLFAVCQLPVRGRCTGCTHPPARCNADLQFWQYLLALIAGLPKQLIAVYVGVVLSGSPAEGDTTPTTTSSRVISDVVFGVTALITLGALWYIYRQMLRVRKGVLLGMREDLRARGVEVREQEEGGTGEASQAGR